MESEGAVARTRIALDPLERELRYEVIDPALDADERRVLDEVRAALPHLVPPEGGPRSPDERRTGIRSAIEPYLDLHHPELTASGRERIAYYVVRDTLGYGAIDAMVRDPEIEDISCDGVGVPVYVVHARHDSVRTSVSFGDEEELDSFVRGLGQRCGATLSVAHPVLDGTTSEGHRVQATYAREVTSRGASFTLRRYQDRPFTPVDLVRSGTASPEMIAYLWLGAEHGESLLVCGGPGAGKTSTLNALGLFVPPGAKIVSIEDSRELRLPHENWIAAATRSGGGERGPDGKGTGEIDMFDLVRAALRQRPSHIIVGEVRGREAFALFQAMATGHATCATIHADSVRSMISRLENPPIGVPRILLGSLREVVVQAQVPTAHGVVRRIRQIVEIVRLEPETNEIATNPVFEWDATSDAFRFQGHAYLFDRVAAQHRWGEEATRREFVRRTEFVRGLVERPITHPGELWRWIARYGEDPDSALARLEHGPGPGGEP